MPEGGKTSTHLKIIPRPRRATCWPSCFYRRESQMPGRFDRMQAIASAVFSPCAGLVLWTGKRYLAFGAEDITIKACDPVPPARRHVEIPYFGLNVRRDAVPIKLRVAIDDVGG